MILVARFIGSVCELSGQPAYAYGYHGLFTVHFELFTVCIKFKVAYTSGRKCLYSLVNYFYRNFECILMKPQINLFQK